MAEIALEAVYYGSPIPRGKSQLTALGLLFDRIHFPNVSLPADGVDFAALRKEIQRIEAHKLKDYSTQMLLAIMRMLEHVKDLQEFCKFTGNFGSIFAAEPNPEANKLVSALEDQIFGPPPAGVLRSYMPASHKGIDGIDRELSITYSNALHYPANAIVYAAQNQLPLVNDSSLPVPALGGVSYKNNAKVLTSVLAMECLSLVMPTVPPLMPLQICQLREELKDTVQPFRAALARLAGRLNDGITEDASHEELLRLAQFLVATEVQPLLVELKYGVDVATKSFTAKTFDMVKHIPSVAGAFASMDPSMAIAHALAAVGGILSDHQSGSSKASPAKSPMYFLLRLEQIAGTRMSA